MRLFDLHCDTIYECLRLSEKLSKNNLNIDLERGTVYDSWVQTFAFWISDDLRGDAAYENFLKQYEFFQNSLTKNKNISIYTGSVKPNCCNAILSIEGGAALGGQIERIEQIAKKGIKILTLCWNDANEIASGAFAQGGFTEFGKQCVAELERHNIIIDVSHLNCQGFGELCDLATKPFIATHSNCDAVHPHKRNLTDQQIKEIVARNGIIGINFYTQFISNKQDPRFSDLKRHIDHFLQLGCEDVLALGSDFDGATMPTFLYGIERIAKLHKDMVNYYGKALTDKILFKNAQVFFKKNIYETRCNI